MLNLILGRCGSGKSDYIQNVIKSHVENSVESVILVVPEQSSFANERLMIDILGNVNCNKVNVLSFSRMYDFVSQKLGIPQIIPIDDITQNLVMCSAIDNVSENLCIYKTNSFKTDISEAMLKTMQELKSNNITKNSLLNIYNNSSDGLLKRKVSEMMTIFDEYNSLCEGKFSDYFDNITKLTEIINKNKVFDGSIVLFDEFNSFTPQQFDMISAIMKQSKELYMTFCTECENSDSDFELFSHINNTVHIIKNIAKKENIKINQPVILQRESKNTDNDIKLLEKNIFSYSKAEYLRKSDDIKIYCATNIYDEVERVAQTILRLVIENGYKFSDFTVITRSIETYGRALKNIFKKHGIPLFIDNSESILNTSLINLITSIFNCVISGFKRNDVLRYLKTGFLKFSPEEIYELENYALLWDINGETWFQDFKFHPQGFSEVWAEKDLKILENVNRIRKSLIEPILEFKKNVNNMSAVKISEEIYKFLLSINADDTIRQYYAKLKNMEKYSLAEKESKIWDSVMIILNSIAKVMGSKRVSIKKYFELFISAANSAKYSSIPQTHDSVMVGDISKMRIASSRAVFILGASEGSFPLNVKQSLLFTEDEIAKISKLDINICDTAKTFLIKERFLAYVAISCAKEKLYISWSLSEKDGECNMPSEIVTEVCSIFKNAEILDSNKFSIQENIWSESAAFDHLCRCYNKNPIIAKTLFESLKNSYKYRNSFKMLSDFSSKKMLEFNDTKILKNIFGEKIKLSASQIEKYYQCRFEYFCKYVLKAKLNKSVSFSSSEYGIMAHIVFEKFFKKYSHDSLFNITDDEILSEISEIINSYIATGINENYVSDNRFQYIINNAKRFIYVLVKRLVEEFKQSKFTVADCELEISKSGQVMPLMLECENGSKVQVEGKIDRVDTMEDANGNYLRIVDYKTGKKKFSLVDVLYGLNMQMLIYLMTLCKNGKERYDNITPGGILYFRALNPLVNCENKDSIKAKKEVNKSLQMAGLILNNIEVLTAMEEKLEGKFIPVTMNNGKLKNIESTVSEKDFNIIFSHVEKMIDNMVCDLMEGNIYDNPILINAFSTSCDYCEYFPICRHCKKEFRKILNMKNSEVIKKMDAEKSDK